MDFLESIYINNVKLPDSYFQKYEVLPQFPGKRTTGSWNIYRGWDNHDFPRVWCILDFIEWTKNIKGNNLAFTCDEDPELEFIWNNFNQHMHLPFPPYDLHDLPNLKDKIDFFVFNQTIEHLYDPDLAIKNISKNMNIGGHIFTSVPTINIPHMTPIHFGGLTPMGLAVLFLKNNFSIENIGQFGNYKYIEYMFTHHSWPDHQILKDKNGHIKNEEKNCCQCWILAKKNGDI